jgi:hypothetical protein
MRSLITFFVLAISFSFVNAQELMRNGGFENNVHFEFWNANVSVTGASVEPVNTEAHLGSWSVEIQSGTSPVGGWTQLMQTLLTPSNNINYKFTFWVKGNVTTSNFFGVYGINDSGEVALGIDTLNNTSVIDPDSGRIVIIQDLFQNWSRINYYFNSGQDYTSYLFKFEEATSGNSLTLFLDDFSILPVPGQATIHVNSPNGGEDWIPFEEQSVTWTSSNVTNVKIDYSTNNGGLWLNVVSSIPAASGSYSWTIPNTPSTECLVRISNASLASVFDISDSVFTISPLVTVTSPNGGEDWWVNEQHNITWISQNLTNVRIEYSTNNGIAWLDVVSSVPAASGSYSWTVPNTPSSQCLVRISDTSNASVNDLGDSSFTISNLVIVISPNGGEHWTGEDQQNITWTSHNLTNVSIEYSADNGSNWISIVASTPASAGSYSWTLPDTTSSQCLIRISDANNASINDVSDATFTITAALHPSVTVNTPNGGETWIVLTTHQITWTTQDISLIKIEYSTNNGSVWTVLVASRPVTGSVYWTVPNIPSTQYLVRISDVTNAAINDVSDSTFTVQNPVLVDDLKSGVPEEYDLSQSYPNPFNPSTTIEFSLPEATDVSLNIYNTLGQKVAELVNSKMEAGYYSYVWDARDVTTGMYIYELRTDKFVSIKKMILLK